MKFSGQISKFFFFVNITNSLHHKFFLLRKIRPKLTMNQLKMIGEGIVMSRLQYCISVFGNSYTKDDNVCANSQHMKELQKCQNDYMRLLTKTRIRDKVSIETLLDKTNLLSVNQITAKHQLMNAWSIIQNDIEPMASILKGRANENLRSATNKYINPSSKCTMGFSNQVNRLWKNKDLDEKFRTTNVKSVAKTRVKKFVTSAVPRIPWRRL